MKKFNKKYIGPSLDDFLQEEGLLEQTKAVAIKRRLVAMSMNVLLSILTPRYLYSNPFTTCLAKKPRKLKKKSAGLEQRIDCNEELKVE